MNIVDNIKKALEKLDEMQGQTICFINPDDAQLLRTAFPHIEDEIIFKETAYITRGKCFTCKKEKIDYLNLLLGY